MSDRLTIEEALDASRALGVAALQLYAIVSEPVAGLSAIRTHLDAHLAHQMALEADGIMFGAGPLGTVDGRHYDGAGLIIVRATSLAEARAIAERDPMHMAGARRFHIRPWILNEGTVTITTRLSDGTARIR